MLNFLIIHGTYSNPEGNWFPWLGKELGKHGNAMAPRFPTPENQSFETWKKVANKALAGISPADTVLIGHSIAAAFILRMAELTPQPYKALFPVCPWTGDLGLPDYDPLNATFTRHTFDWKRVKSGAEKIICVAGDNDPYVPLNLSKDVAAHAATEFIIVKNGGHLNGEAGYQEFPLLLEKIQQLSR